MRAARGHATRQALSPLRTPSKTVMLEGLECYSNMCVPSLPLVFGNWLDCAAAGRVDLQARLRKMM